MSTSPQQHRQEATLEDLATALDGGATLIDVREPGEYAEAHVPGARLIPMGQLPSRMGDLDRDEPVYLICASGNRSGAMLDLLTSAGYRGYNVLGGTSAWIRAGRPVDAGLNS